MSRPTPYVIALSSDTRESLATFAADLAAFVARRATPSPRLAFGRALSIEAIAHTLLFARDAHPWRVAFVAQRVAEIPDALLAFCQDAEDCAGLLARGVFCNAAPVSVLAGEGDSADGREHVARLARAARHASIAKLWVMGFDADWAIVHPDLVGRAPTYLPVRGGARARHWPTTDGAHLRAAPPPIVRAVAPTEEATPRRAPLARDVATLPAPIAQQRVLRYLQERVAEVLGLRDGDLPPTDRGFFDLGMTSIHLAAVRSAIVRDLGVEPSETSAFDHPTLGAFTRYVVDLARAASAPARARAADPPTKAPTAKGLARALHALDLDAIDKLTARDLERVLEQVG